MSKPADNRTRTLVTPEGIALPLTIASRGSRAGALMLDVTIIVTGLIAFYLMVIWIAGGLLEGTSLDPSAAPRGAQEFLLILLALAGFLTWYGYFLIQELGPRGATLGKRIVGIRIAPRDGGRLTAEAVIARNLLRDIEVFYPLVTLLTIMVMNSMQQDIGALGWVMTGWLALFLLFPFFNRDALRAGDIIAGTWVVERPRTRLAETLSTQGAAAASGASTITGARYTFGEAELSVYGEKELQTLERMLREAQPEALTAVHDTICRKIGWEPGAGDERAFLEAFYTQLRAKLEGDMRFGKRKADKFS
ncbi:RDD family protein [Porphyrobacter sp. LM 6]|uniref:RDD family protein n=1 Tax=Porphyrobacter sp. LM 6 TaxID=1896196 RepID=UPI00084687CA|nr:RDD family protein [Porphyrobacter sp. LM 6]AOL93760.1 putative membrane protein, YckC-RDD family [Porphyrobacter sp. LM 6]